MISIKCKKCRRAGQKLFLKGERCYSQKCAIIKRPYPPGLHGKRRSSLSEYGKQLLEKQKIRNIYGVLERQFKKYVLESEGKTGDKREFLFKKLEKRLDNVIFRAGFAKNRTQARQIISHGHVLVNGRRMNIPSYEVKVGDIMNVKAKTASSPLFKDLKEILKKHTAPNWMSVDAGKLEIKINSDISDLDSNMMSSLGMIIEFYSR